MEETSAPTPVLEKPVSRRSFLIYGWGAFLAFLAAAAGSTLRFILPNVLYEPSQKFRAGKVKEYPFGITIDKANRVWIIRNDKGDRLTPRFELAVFAARQNHSANGANQQWGANPIG